LSLAALFSAFKASSSGVVFGSGAGWVDATGMLDEIKRQHGHICD